MQGRRRSGLRIKRLWRRCILLWLCHVGLRGHLRWYSSNRRHLGRRWLLHVMHRLEGRCMLG